MSDLSGIVNEQRREIATLTAEVERLEKELADSINYSKEGWRQRAIRLEKERDAQADRLAKLERVAEAARAMAVLPTSDKNHDALYEALVDYDKLCKS